MVMPKAHDFDTDRDSWERVVFDEAAYFTVYRRYGRGVNQKLKFNGEHAFLKAVENAVTGDNSVNPMIYAVTAHGRFVMIPKPQWIPLMQEYAKQVDGCEEK